MLSLTGGMKYVYCEGNVSFHYKWDGLDSYIRYVLNEDPRSGKVFIFMHKSRRQLRVFYYERNGYVLSEKKLDSVYSLTQSCKCCKVNPYDYWKDLLTNAYDPKRTIDSFMPHLWHKAY